MLQIPQETWNEIAPRAKNPAWRRLFSMDSNQIKSAMAELADRLAAEGVDPVVALAYRELAPLLQEREAIRAYSMTSLTPLPEVLTTNEAILLAIKDHHLKVSQTRVLRKLLDGPVPIG